MQQALFKENFTQVQRMGLKAHFDGPEFVSDRDQERLTSQHKRIREFMIDGRWRTLAQIAEELGYPESSVSAQLRHLREKRFGSYRVMRRYVENGLFEYQVLPPEHA